MAMITWEQLDSLTESEIVFLLLEKEIKGVLESRQQCPLAVATGWCVNRSVRWLYERFDETSTLLTREEMNFVHHFDKGDYPDLILK